MERFIGEEKKMTDNIPWNNNNHTVTGTSAMIEDSYYERDARIPPSDDYRYMFPYNDGYNNNRSKDPNKKASTKSPGVTTPMPVDPTHSPIYPDCARDDYLKLSETSCGPWPNNKKKQNSNFNTQFRSIHNNEQHTSFSRVSSPIHPHPPRNSTRQLSQAQHYDERPSYFPEYIHQTPCSKEGLFERRQGIKDIKTPRLFVDTAGGNDHEESNHYNDYVSSSPHPQRTRLDLSNNNRAIYNDSHHRIDRKYNNNVDTFYPNRTKSDYHHQRELFRNDNNHLNYKEQVENDDYYEPRREEHMSRHPFHGKEYYDDSSHPNYKQQQHLRQPTSPPHPTDIDYRFSKREDSNVNRPYYVTNHHNMRDHRHNHNNISKERFMEKKNDLPASEYHHQSNRESSEYWEQNPPPQHVKRNSDQRYPDRKGVSSPIRMNEQRLHHRSSSSISSSSSSLSSIPPPPTTKRYVRKYSNNNDNEYNNATCTEKKTKYSNRQKNNETNHYRDKLNHQREQQKQHKSNAYSDNFPDNDPDLLELKCIQGSGSSSDSIHQYNDSNLDTKKFMALNKNLNSMHLEEAGEEKYHHHESDFWDDKIKNIECDIKKITETRKLLFKETMKAMEMRETCDDLEEIKFWDEQVKVLNQCLAESRIQEKERNYQLLEEERKLKSKGKEVKQGLVYLEEQKKLKLKEKDLTVKAPFQLPSGFKFSLNVDGKLRTAIVPSGGVQKGEIFVAKLQEDGYDKSMGDHFNQKFDENYQVVKVRAPSRLSGGFKFKIKVGSSFAVATVPQGGVEKGDIFEASYVMENK